MATKRYIGWIVFVVVSGLAVWLFRETSVSAQGPQCPPGFIWQPNSGVGCVQENCPSLSGAKFSDTSRCICQDGFKACYGGVDYSSFDAASCGPFCPNSVLLSCIDPKSECPKDPAEAQPAAPAPQTFEELPDEEGPSIEEMTRFLEEALLPPSAGLPSRSQSAASGVTAGMLIVVLALALASSSEKFSVEQFTEKILLNLQKEETKTQSKSNEVQRPIEAILKPGEETIEKLRQSAVQSGQVPKSAVTPEKLLALQNEFQHIVDVKVNEGYYVMNKDALSKVWNWTVFLVRDPILDLKGGQCGEMADNGQGWLDKYVQDHFGREAIIDKVFIYEQSSRYPQNYRDYADALYANNHAATRVILPDGESYILDFWEAIAERQSKGPGVPLQIRIIPEKDWILKWKMNIGSSSDPAEVSNVNPKQADLRNFLQQAGALHPLQIAHLPPDQYEKAVQVTQNALEQWRSNRRKISPVETDMLINNWKKHGMLWGNERVDPPGGPAQALADAKNEIVDLARKKLN